MEKSVLSRTVKFWRAKSNQAAGKDGGMSYSARVAKRGEVSYELFKDIHHDKGNIGQHQGRKTLRTALVLSRISGLVRKEL